MRRRTPVSHSDPWTPTLPLRPPLTGIPNSHTPSYQSRSLHSVSTQKTKHTSIACSCSNIVARDLRMVQRGLVINLWGTGERRGDPGSALSTNLADSVVCSAQTCCRTRSRRVVWANRKLNMKLKWIPYLWNRAENGSWSSALAQISRRVTSQLVETN